MSLNQKNYYNLLVNLKKQTDIITKPLNTKTNNHSRLINSYRIKVDRMVEAKSMYNVLTKMILSIPSGELPSRVSKTKLRNEIVQTKHILNRIIKQTKTTYNLMDNLEAKSWSLPAPPRIIHTIKTK